MVYTFNPSTPEAEAGVSLSEASLVYTASSRAARTTQKPGLTINKQINKSVIS